MVPEDSSEPEDFSLSEGSSIPEDPSTPEADGTDAPLPETVTADGEEMTGETEEAGAERGRTDAEEERTKPDFLSAALALKRGRKDLPVDAGWLGSILRMMDGMFGARLKAESSSDPLGAETEALRPMPRNTSMLWRREKRREEEREDEGNVSPPLSAVPGLPTGVR